MNTFFYIAAAVAFLTTVLAITGRNPIHSLLNLIVSLLAISVIFYLLGAPFIAALEVIIYAGAIMVLFIFATMMLNIGLAREMERRWLRPSMWVWPSLFAAVLLGDFLYIMRDKPYTESAGITIDPGEVGFSLYTDYLIGVEISAILLMAGIVGAYHLGKQTKRVFHRYLEEQQITESDEITK